MREATCRYSLMTKIILLVIIVSHRRFLVKQLMQTENHREAVAIIKPVYNLKASEAGGMSFLWVRK